jgi:hypothetical protein
VCEGVRVMANGIEVITGIERRVIRSGNGDIVKVITE